MSQELVYTCNYCNSTIDPLRLELVSFKFKLPNKVPASDLDFHWACWKIIKSFISSAEKKK